jgi:hypothetical protein
VPMPARRDACSVAGYGSGQPLALPCARAPPVRITCHRIYSFLPERIERRALRSGRAPWGPVTLLLL